MFGIKGLIKPLSVKPDRRQGKPWNGRDFILLNDLVYKSKAGIIITVPKGFHTNFATWLKPTGRYIEASVIHDYLYGQRAGRKYADKMFKELMERGGCPRWRVNMMYYGVRLFGWYAYSKSKKQER